MVSVEELLHCDLTSIGKISVDKDAFWKNIDMILPIVTSENAMKNRHFKKAYEAHKAFYNELHLVSFDGIDKVFDVCIDGYLEAIDDERIEAEAAANIIAIWFLLMMSMKTATIMKNHPAALMQVASKDEKARRIIENTDPSFEADARAALKEFDDDDMKEMLSEMLIAVKKSKSWSDLADYYLALRYVWNLIDNDLDWGFNQRIGAEMMDSFMKVKNVYAARFLKYSFNSIREASSQSVDDT